MLSVLQITVITVNIKILNLRLNRKHFPLLSYIQNGISINGSNLAEKIAKKIMAKNTEPKWTMNHVNACKWSSYFWMYSCTHSRCFFFQTTLSASLNRVLFVDFYVSFHNEFTVSLIRTLENEWSWRNFRCVLGVCVLSRFHPETNWSNFTRFWYFLLNLKATTAKNTSLKKKAGSDMISFFTNFCSYVNQKSNLNGKNTMKSRFRQYQHLCSFHHIQSSDLKNRA